MTEQWYYAEHGRQIGPLSPEQLRQAAASGQLSPSAMVWREGMAEWVPAQRLKGLFQSGGPRDPATPPPVPVGVPAPILPAPLPTAARSGPPPIPAATSAESPPPIPLAQSVPPIPTAVGMGTQFSSLAPPPTAPALWNPFAARAWTLLFTPIFGASLHAQNWKALGEMGRAKRSMIWVYAFIGLVVIALFSPDAASPVIRLIGVAGVLAWCVLDAEQQVRYVKQRFGKEYPRKSWVKPLAFGAGGWAGLIVVAAIVTAGGSDSYGNLLTFNGGQLFFKAPVTESEANAAGRYLVKEGSRQRGFF